VYGLLKGSYKDFIKAVKNDRKIEAFYMTKKVIFLLIKIKLKNFYLLKL